MSTPSTRTRAAATPDAVFAALADPTRRATLTALRAGERTVSELSAEHPLALPSFMKHVQVLEAAGLITTRKDGRVRRCALTERGLAPAEEWMREHTAHWTASLDRLAEHLEETT
ncbi:MAG: metalloregulator ArsR/SmtB family transcription factor [Microcella sp.]|uniref:ArsR/SmtB family transcription factor n=1 Tax=Microcella sp. TaxID=1913979 RepID=UPI003315255B